MGHLKMMNWWESTDRVPIPRRIVLDELESKWPDVQFSVNVQEPGKNTPVQYDISWVAGPTNEEVSDFLTERLGHFGVITTNLIRTVATEFGTPRKGKS